MIVFGTDDKDLYAVRAAGQVLWHTRVDSPIGRALPILASLGSGKPVVMVATSFVGAFQGLDALDAKTGKMLWRAPSLLQSYQSTAVADIDGDGAPEVLFGDKSNRVYCVDAHGQPRWNVHLDGRGIYSAPAIADLEGKGQAMLFQVTRGDECEREKSLCRGRRRHKSWIPGNCRAAARVLPSSAVGRMITKCTCWLPEVPASCISYHLTQNPGAKILWTGLQGSFATPPPSLIARIRNPSQGARAWRNENRNCEPGHYDPPGAIGGREVGGAPRRGS